MLTCTMATALLGCLSEDIFCGFVLSPLLLCGMVFGVWCFWLRNKSLFYCATKSLLGLLYSYHRYQQFQELWVTTPGGAPIGITVRTVMPTDSHTEVWAAEPWLKHPSDTHRPCSFFFPPPPPPLVSTLPPFHSALWKFSKSHAAHPTRQPSFSPFPPFFPR